MANHWTDLENIRWPTTISSSSKGPRRVCRFCILGILLPIVILCIPLYMRYRALQSLTFRMSPSDMKLLNQVRLLTRAQHTVGLWRKLGRIFFPVCVFVQGCKTERKWSCFSKEMIPLWHQHCFSLLLLAWKKLWVVTKNRFHIRVGNMCWLFATFVSYIHKMS